MEEQKRVEKFFDYYDNVEREEALPEGNEYDFLLQRNKNYMNNIALSFLGRKITYEEMHTRIDEYARALYKRGIRKGDTIAVCLLNTPESVYLLYALKKIGALVVGLSPLNNEYKMLRDLELTKPKMVISVDMLYSNIKNAKDTLNFSPILYSPIVSSSNPFQKTIYNVKQLKDGNKLFKSENRLSSIIRDGKYFDRVEYSKHINGTCTDILFTGGSTGVHKGVMLDGNGLNSVVRASDYSFILEPGMVHLGNVPFGHMCFGRFVLHYCLCKNMEYALTLKMMPQDFLDEMIRVKANGAMGGPVHWEALIDNPKLTKGCLSNLIQPISGGELFKPLKLIQANEALRFAGCDREIGNGLGSTETWAPTHLCVGGRNDTQTAGYEMPFVHTRIVDSETFKEVEDGKEGLMFVRGPGMMLGYFENPEETDLAFHYDKDGVKWYNTRDIGVKMPSKEYKYIGRKKRNFVSGVDNIYPEQIEQILLQIPEIREVIVTPIPDDNEQFLPKYHISLYKEFDDIKFFEEKMFSLIENTLGVSALPGYIEYHYKPLPRTDNQKLDSSGLGAQDLAKISEQIHCRTRVR